MRDETADTGSGRSDSDAVERAAVVVAGGGIVALCAALALRRELGPEARVVLANDIPSTDAASDGRAFAIAPSGRRLLAALAAWDGLAEAAQPITDIAVTDSRLDDPVRPTFLSFGREGKPGEALAHMVDARALHEALASGAESAGIERIPYRILRVESEAQAARLTFVGGRTIEASLLVAADGVRSLCREMAGIAWIGWDYPQLGLTATIAHERDHEGRAYEHFLPGGPFAVLPLKGRRSSIVWTEARGEAERLLTLGDAVLAREIARRIGHALGEPRLESGVAAYPLRFGVARSFIGRRLALIGDAAHVIHPIAGQGLNLGFRDVLALTEAVGDAVRLGLDLGHPHALSRYQRARRFDTTAMGAATDGLNRLFSNDATPLRALRDLGLGIVERLPALKRVFMAEAAGSVGDEAARGE